MVFRPPLAAAELVGIIAWNHVVDSPKPLRPCHGGLVLAPFKTNFIYLLHHRMLQWGAQPRPTVTVYPKFLAPVLAHSASDIRACTVLVDPSPDVPVEGASCAHL